MCVKERQREILQLYAIKQQVQSILLNTNSLWNVHFLLENTSTHVQILDELTAGGIQVCRVLFPGTLG